MRAFGFAAVAAMLTVTLGLPSAYALDVPAGAPSGKATKVKPSKAVKPTTKSTALPVAHDFAGDLTRRHLAIQHPKLAAPADFGVKGNASIDRPREVHVQTNMNRTPPSPGKVGLKLHF